MTCARPVQLAAALVARPAGSQVYRGVVELCVQRYKDAEGLYVGVPEAALASLRAQLLMALHDSGATHLCAQVRAAAACRRHWFRNQSALLSALQSAIQSALQPALQSVHHSALVETTRKFRMRMGVCPRASERASD